MKTLRARFQFLGFIALLFPAGIVSAAELGFATMEDGDRVEITYSSEGCFHNFTNYYEVSRQAGVSVFREYAIKWDQSTPAIILEKKILGEVSLTQDQIDGFDAYLRFYRGKKEVMSTTQSSMIVEYFEGANRVGIENLSDPSGEHGLENRKDVISFYRLAESFQR